MVVNISNLYHVTNLLAARADKLEAEKEYEKWAAQEQLNKTVSW